MPDKNEISRRNEELRTARDELREWGGDKKSEEYQRDKSLIDKTWTNYCSEILPDKIQLSRRRDNLNFAHYSEVANNNYLVEVWGGVPLIKKGRKGKDEISWNESTLKKQLLMWLKGEAIDRYLQEVYGGVPAFGCWVELSKIVNRNRDDLHRWHKIYKSNPNYEEFEKKVYLTPTEMVVAYKRMEKHKGGRGKTLSDSDRVYRQKRAAKMLGISTDSLSKAYQGKRTDKLLSDSDRSEVRRKRVAKEIAEYRIRLEKIKGKWLEENIQWGGATSSSMRLKLEDIGITWNESSQAQLIARLEKVKGKWLEENIQWGGARLEAQTLKLNDIGISKFEFHQAQLIARLDKIKGKWLEENIEHKGGGSVYDSGTLKNIGISRNESSQAQLIARLEKVKGKWLEENIEHKGGKPSSDTRVILEDIGVLKVANGNLLLEENIEQGRPKKVSDANLLLDDIGISKFESSQAQLIARLDNDINEELIKELKTARKELSKSKSEAGKLGAKIKWQATKVVCQKTWTDYCSDILPDKYEFSCRHENLDKIELSCRQDNLSFVHHSEKADLDKEGFYNSRLIIEVSMWYKGEAIGNLGGVNSQNYFQLEKKTGKDHKSLKKWHELYKKYPTLELNIAREELSYSGREKEQWAGGTFVSPDKTWADYCKNIWNTQEEIAEKFHMDRSNVSKILKDVKKSKFAEIHIPDSDSEKLNISQPKVAKRLNFIQKLHLQERNIPDSLQYFDVWNTIEKIAEILGVTQKTISNVIDFSKNDKITEITKEFNLMEEENEKKI